MVKQQLRTIKYFILRNFTRIYSCFKPIERKILFESFGGLQYSDNPKAISEVMHKYYPDFMIVWSINCNHLDLPQYIKTCKRSDLSFYKELATSFCFVTNENIGEEIYKRKEQFFIQTWHGDKPLKKVLYDINGFLTNVIDDVVDDLCIAGSKAGERQYRTAFKYKGEVLMVGTPRNDKLIINNKESLNLIKSKINIPDNTKILLYAPTFRDIQKGKQNSLIDLNETLEHLSAKGEKWIALIRAHPASKGLIIQGNNIIDVTEYPDMSDLLCITDMLITDYSSCAGDFAITGKPVILAVFDYDYYKTYCREFAYNLEETGFILAKDQNELNIIIDTMDENDYKNNCNRINNFFGVCETGKSSEIICRRINEEYLKKHLL